MATPFMGIATPAQLPFNTGLFTPSPTPGTHPDDVSCLAMPASDVPQTGVAASRLILSQSQMNGLIARGVKPVEPHNGPNEGDPVYEVQATPVIHAMLAAMASNDEFVTDDVKQLIDPSLHRPAPH